MFRKARRSEGAFDALQKMEPCNETERWCQILQP